LRARNAAKRWPGNARALTHHQFKIAPENGGQRHSEHKGFGGVRKITELVEVPDWVDPEIQKIDNGREPKCPS
jgi:hypothetical protein